MPGIPGLFCGLSSQTLKPESFANELLLALLLLALLPHPRQCPSCQEQGLLQIPSLQRWDAGLVKAWKLQQTPWKLFFLSIQWQLLALPEQSG